MMVSKAANGETLNGIPHGDPVASRRTAKALTTIPRGSTGTVKFRTRKCHLSCIVQEKDIVYTICQEQS